VDVTTPEVRPPNRVLVFVVLVLALLMSTIDQTIVATALHTLQRELHATIIWTGWTITATASLACGVASNIYLLVGLRAVQAIGGAGFTPSATGPRHRSALRRFGSRNVAIEPPLRGLTSARRFPPLSR
jgi:MFS family permease